MHVPAAGADSSLGSGGGLGVGCYVGGVDVGLEGSGGGCGAWGHGFGAGFGDGFVADGYAGFVLEVGLVDVAGIAVAPS